MKRAEGRRKEKENEAMRERRCKKEPD